MSSGSPINFKDLDTSSIERPARLVGGCQFDVARKGEQLELLRLLLASLVPSSLEISEVPSVSSQANSVSVPVVKVLGLGVLGGKIGHDRLCFVFDSSIGLSLCISEL